MPRGEKPGPSPWGDYGTTTGTLYMWTPQEKVLIIFTPGYTVQKGTEAADETAQGLLTLAPLYRSPSFNMV